jgi:hypothetical protein
VPTGLRYGSAPAALAGGAAVDEAGARKTARDGRLRFGGWVWRYDLAPAGPSETTVTLSYDWSAVPGFLRQHIGFPPFPPDHLGNSLAHLASLAAA